MKLSQSVTYAIQATLQLASTGDLAAVSCGQLAQRGNMPERFLLQILRDLAKRGIMQSSRGGGGGFRLQRLAEEISLLDLIETIDGPQTIKLPINLSLPQHSQMVLEATLGRISDTTRRQLGELKLSHLMETATKELPNEGQTDESIDVSETVWPIVERIAG